jgi:GntR family transcriptional regulator
MITHQQDAFVQTATIDLNSPVPYYYQMSEWFRDNIAKGKLQPGQQVPSEANLCKSFGVSRTVVRQALNELVNEGLLYRRKGKGAFVAEPKIRESLVQKLTGFYQDMVDRGFAPITKVLEMKVVSASNMLAEQLNLTVGEQVMKIDRLRFVNGEPIVYVTTYLPYAACPALLNENLTNQSLYAILEEKFGLQIVRGRRTLEAMAANDQDAKLLRITAGSPIVLLKSVSYLKDGHPIEYYEAKHRGDRSQFEVELIRVREPEKPLGHETSPSNLPSSNGLKSNQ